MRIYGHPLLFFSPALLLAMLEREVFSFPPQLVVDVVVQTTPHTKEKKKKRS
jgi:hypothetical protein